MNKQGKGKIEYLDYTWNPVSGCKHSCRDEYCYAAKIAKRFMPHEFELMDIADCKPIIPISANNLGCYECDKPVYLTNFKRERLRYCPYPAGFKPTIHRYRLDEPQKVKKSSIIGVVYMGDLFGDWVPDAWITEVMQIVKKCSWHTFLFLTKNPEKYEQLLNTYGRLFFPDNAYFGATADTKQRFEVATIEFQKLKFECRMEGFQEIKTFISAEPLLENILSYNPDWVTWIDWMIIGTQTGPGSKSPKSEWVQGTIAQCQIEGVPVFVKSPLFEKFPIQEWPEGLRRQDNVEK